MKSPKFWCARVCGIHYSVG